MTHPLVRISEDLTREVDDMTFQDPVERVYNPLVYAKSLHDAYLENFGDRTPREVLLVGMNPGPWGMGQTGVPFGDVDFVGDWMGLSAEVGKPDNEHPKRPVDGLDCDRNEVSGSRLWGWAKDRYETADQFFERYFVHNYCPLLFLEDSGRNRTPNKLKADERRELFPHCDRSLRSIIEYLEPTFVVGVGAFATRRVKAALKPLENKPIIGRILHPSPASPQANKGWAPQAEEQLEEIGIDL
jgi:single-strand selective monofunctional uracil DNA glycosylase